jgi:hypothetical protein
MTSSRKLLRLISWTVGLLLLLASLRVLVRSAMLIHETRSYGSVEPHVLGQDRYFANGRTLLAEVGSEKLCLTTLQPTAGRTDGSSRPQCPIRGVAYRVAIEKALQRAKYDRIPGITKLCLFDPLGCRELAAIPSKLPIERVDEFSWPFYLVRSPGLDGTIVVWPKELLMIPGAMAAFDVSVQTEDECGLIFRILMLDVPFLGWVSLG